MNTSRLPFIASVCSFFVFCMLWPYAANGQQPQSRARVVAPVNDAQLVTLRGNTHPLARPQFDRGVAPDNLPVHRMLMLLSRSPEQQAALDAFVDSQHTPGSPNYRQWLTPAEFAARFGPAQSDVQAVTGWLQQQGFSVGRIAGGNTVIEFSGTAGQLRQAFHTELHKYVVKGEEHWANAQDPQIPAALAPVVRGLVSLNNFQPKPMLRREGVFTRDVDGNVVPAYTVTSSSGTQFYGIGPADFATIYNTQPLKSAGIDGTGEKIAILGVSNIQLSDVATFRTFFGLPPSNNTRVEPDGPDPGLVPGAETEADLDVQWANAVAPGASVLLVPAESTETTRGTDLAALHVIENNMADVINLSFSECESYLGASGTQFFNSLWQQAAAQGITVVVSTGDNGSAGCDDQDFESAAVSGLGVNGFASTAYNVAVGGTDFNDAGQQSIYWNSSNNTQQGWLSAKSYIPEIPWNDTCAATATASNLATCAGVSADQLDIFGGSGGKSIFNTKPAWQSGPGVPGDGFRDIPDVSFYAAAGTSSRSFYVVCEADVVPSPYPSCQHGSNVFFLGVGGTSASAPSFAGIVALAAQKAGTRLGNVNYFLYSMAAAGGNSCASTSGSTGASCIFNDVTTGNISVPCTGASPNCSSSTSGTTGILVWGSPSAPAYTAGQGYDLATGLGSLNATNFANTIAADNASAAKTTTTLTLNGSSTGPINVTHGAAISIGVNVTSSSSAAPTGEVSVIGGNDGMTVHSLDVSGSATWSSPLFPGGSYAVKAHYAGDGVHQASDSTPVIPVTVTPEDSKTFVNLVSFDLNTGAPNFTATSVAYGSPYILRVDVTNSGGTISSSTGVNSTCSNKMASCPTGTITLTSTGAAPYGGSFKLNSQGYAEDQPIQLPAGSYTISANYSGDGSYNPSAATPPLGVTVTRAQTSLALNSPPGTVYQYGTPAPINGVVFTESSGVGPGGTISILENNSPAVGIRNTTYTPQSANANGPATLTGQASYVPSVLGTHTFTATYSGDSNYLGSNTAGPFSILVNKAGLSLSTANVPTAIAPNTAATVSVTMVSTSLLNAPTGSVTFLDNGAPIVGAPTVTPVNGGGGANAGFMAQMPVTFTQTGAHALSISYAGDANYNSVTQAVGTVNVTTTPVSLSLPAGGNQATFPSIGGTGNASVMVTNSTTAALPVSVSCTADSAAARCSVASPSFTVPANASATTSVSYTVPALTGKLNHGLPFGAPFVFAGVLLGFARLGRKKRALLMAVVAVAMALSMASCGGGHSSSSTNTTGSAPSPKVYNFNITATSGSNTDSKTITVTVQ